MRSTIVVSQNKKKKNVGRENDRIIGLDITTKMPEIYRKIVFWFKLD